MERCVNKMECPICQLPKEKEKGQNYCICDIEDEIYTY